MASGVNVKMGVSGVQQFKQGMQQARQSVKTLDAELQLNEKQFKASGDAEEYMQKKADLLQKKIQEQQKAVDNATKALEEMEKNGVDKASTAYQKMAQQLAQSKSELIDTETALGNIGTAAEEVESGVSGMQQQLQGINKGVSYDNVTSALHSITSGMETVMRTAINLGKTITREVLGAGSWADDLATRATYYGMSQEDLQRMEKTADLIDTPVDAIINAQRKMKKAFGEGKKATANALDELGLGHVVSTDAEDMFWKIGDALMNMGEEYDKEAAAQKLFGRSWVELIPLFEAGREEYEKLNASWNVVPEEQIKALTEMDDKYQTLQNELDTVKNTFLGELAPAATTVLETLTGMVGEFNDYLKTENGKEMMQSLADAVKSLFDDLKNVDPEDVMETVRGVLDKVTDALKWIKEHHQEVADGVKVFIGAWAGLKVAEGVSIALKLINGLTGLASGAASAAASTGTALGTSFATGFVNAFVSVAPAVASLLGITAVAIAPALIAQAADEQRAEQAEMRRKANAEKLTGTDAAFLNQTADALGMKKNDDGSYYRGFLGQRWLGGSYQEIEDLLMGMNSRGAIEKAKLANMLYGTHTSQGNDTWLELQRLWSGEEMDSARLDAILTSVADAYEKMAQQAESSTKAAENAPTKQDLSLFQKVPANIGAAIEKSLAGMGIVMDGQIVAQIVSQYQGAGVVGYVNP